ncbi:MAG TPA: nucleotidyltransferase substrate binding protein [Geobacteraceae bacterium]|nr:nucleotidyltransferase substrate binding protein [Geobacteraceae bacterium]
MNQQDIRWQQRFSNYRKALLQLGRAVELCRQRQLSELEEQGLIQAFEYTYELAWNVLRDFLTYQGSRDLYGSRDTIREAFSAGLIEDGEGWMDMLKDRNRTSHTYNQETADEIARNIAHRYHDLFVALRQKMETIAL